MSDIKTEKAQLRKVVRAAFPGQAIRETESQLIVAHLQCWDVLLRAKTICLYVPLRREADIWPLVVQLMQDSRRQVVLPRVEGPGVMTLRQVNSLEALKPGAYDIPEPGKEAKIVSPGIIDLLIVPLEAVDTKGMRLGKGGGYYDRLLPEICCPAVGVAMKYQRIPNVPAEAWDCLLDAVVDADGIHMFDNQKTLKG